MAKQTKLPVMALALILACVSVGSANATAITKPNDLSGAWYDPSTSGQGFMFDVTANPDGSANVFGGWFTFTLQGMLNEAYPTWFSFQGQIAASEAPSPMDIYYSHGGEFDAPPVVRASLVGSGTLTFSDCTHAVFSYSVPGDLLNSPSEPPPTLTGSISLVRLSADAGCTQETRPKSSRGFSGTWYNPATSGQGLLFDVSDTGGGLFFGGWFTYAQNSGSGLQWYTLQGAFPTNATEADIPVYIAKTETFGSQQGPPNGEPVSRQIGSAHIKFSSCTDAELDYTLTGGPATNGSIALTRLTPVPDDCLLQ